MENSALTSDTKCVLSVDCIKGAESKKKQNQKAVKRLACAVGVEKKPQKEQNTAQSILNKCGSCANVILDQTGLTLQTASILED